MVDDMNFTDQEAKEQLDAIVRTVESNTGPEAPVQSDVATPSLQPETPKEAVSHPANDAPKVKWEKLAPGETVRAGQPVACSDGEGVVEWVKGPNVQIKLNTGFLHRTGIDQVWVQS